MPQVPSTENNFIGGLKTEFTGLNFPENSATDTDNTVYSLTGEVSRRLGFDWEANNGFINTDRTGCAINTYKWNNAGGDGSTQIFVVQVGVTLLFYKSSAATLTNPISTQLLATSVNIGSYKATNNVLDGTSIECQFADGNGFLFVYHPYCDPFYLTYSAGTVTANRITVRIRDFNGVLEPGISDTTRPLGEVNTHIYNLTNQGWIAGAGWSAGILSSYTVSTGSHTFTVAAGLPVVVGQFIVVDSAIPAFMTGVITSYSTTNLVVNITSVDPSVAGQTLTGGTINPLNAGYIKTWEVALGTVPSNADVWWQFKNSSGVFDPATTLDNVTLSTPAPKGHWILDAFSQQRSLVSAVAGMTAITTIYRPRTGCWFQGRTWYTGVDDSAQASGTAPYYTWTENIYFSQIITSVDQLGNCYQVNDPTNENLFDLLPTDGGVITIQGSGPIYKLFPTQNGLLVFAANGIWFITGGQSLGFAANDYSINKISSVQSLGATSFINVQGMPMFWNEEGIYTVEPSKDNTPYGQGGFNVTPITLGTILSFYNSIPLNSKKYVRGDYNPLTYIVQWVYRGEDTTDATVRYQFDKVLNYNVYSKAFYPYTISGGPTNIDSPYIHGVTYIAGPGGSSSPEPTFKYFSSYVEAPAIFQFTFSEERDSTHYVDWWHYAGGFDFTSYFVTAYRLKSGQALRRTQPEYVYMYSGNSESTSYTIQGIWDYSISDSSNRQSMIQTVNNFNPNFGNIFRRHKIRGHGLTLQLKVSSVEGEPFNIIGWSVLDTVNQSI